MSNVEEELLQRIVYIGEEIPESLIKDSRPKFIVLGTPQEFIDATKETTDALKALIAQAVLEEKKSKDNAYWERNQLVAYLASQYESHLVRHPEDDTTWEDDWRWIVCIHTPEGQITWHIHDNDVPTFGKVLVDVDGGHWDGHTTKDKYTRLTALQAQVEGGRG